MISDYPGGPHIISRILIRGKQEGQSQRWSCDNGGRGPRELRKGQSQGMQVDYGNWKSLGHDSPLEPPKETRPSLQLGLSPECWSAWPVITKYHRLGGLNSRNLFLTVLEAGSPKSRCQKIWFLMRLLFLACRWLSFCRVLI